MEFNDLKSFWEYRSKAVRFELSFSEFNEFYDYCVEHKDHLKGIFNGLTMEKLGRIIYLRPGDKKGEAVSSLYKAVLSAFHFSEDSIMYSPFSGQTYESVLNEKIKKQTEEDYFKAIAEREATKKEKEKALSNPETLDEFRVFLQVKAVAELSPDQYRNYIFLVATGQKETEDRRKIVSVATVEIGNVEMILKESRHTIKNIPLFVVQLSNRVERETYTALNSRAKRLGGYYSSYSKGGAIPGFVFENKEAAENFIKTDERVTNEETVEERERKAEVNRAESLEEKAEKLQESGNEILAADRKANTHRRARFAANAEANAQHLLKVAKIMKGLSEKIISGAVQFLTKVKAITEIEELNSLLLRARYKRQTEEKIQGDSHKIPIDENLIKYVKYPWPLFYNANFLRDIEKLKEAPGRKLAANRLLKAYNKKQDYTLWNHSAHVEDLKIVFFEPYKDYNSWGALYYIDEIKRYERIKKLGLTTPELLKAALFEFLDLRSGNILSPEQEAILKVKQIEREFIGKKIPGFFPTPIELAETVIDLAEIKPGNTILEPSAGLGHLAELIRAQYPENDLKLVEYNISLSEALKQKGFEVDNSDFLDYSGGPYDRIIMNPPFENLEDIAHVEHAFKLLAPGGRLVSIMANNKGGERQKVKDFTDFVNNYGYSETNPEGSFKSAFNPTGVNTITVVLDKPWETEVRPWETEAAPAPEQPKFKVGDFVKYEGENWYIGFINAPGKEWAGRFRLSKGNSAYDRQVTKVEPEKVELVKTPLSFEDETAVENFGKFEQIINEEIRGYQKDSALTILKWIYQNGNPNDQQNTAVVIQAVKKAIAEREKFYDEVLSRPDLQNEPEVKEVVNTYLAYKFILEQLRERPMLGKGFFAINAQDQSKDERARKIKILLLRKKAIDLILELDEKN
jgi:tRNA G10  N-methylase Trm11